MNDLTDILVNEDVDKDSEEAQFDYEREFQQSKDILHILGMSEKDFM